MQTEEMLEELLKKAKVDHTPRKSCLPLTWMKLASW